LFADVERAIEALRKGLLVALPTETVYGLAADATNPEAVAAIFEAKGRPKGHPLIAHLGEAGWLDIWAPDAPPVARKLAEAFWPGPLTLIVPRSAKIPDVVTGGRSSVAVRVPAHPITLEIIRGLGRPVAAPSANRFGAVSPTTADHVRAELAGAVAVIVDGGPCEVGVESTILDVSGRTARLVRPGSVTKEALAEVIGEPIEEAADGSVAAPGTLPVHYAPQARLILAEPARLCETANELARTEARVGVLVPSALACSLDDSVMRYELADSLEDHARRLYAGLRYLDENSCSVIVAPRISEGGIGRAIADRLQRAATDEPDKSS